jgi:hypothetical protein
MKINDKKLGKFGCFLVPLESPWWVGAYQGSFMNFQTFGARDIKFWIMFVIGIIAIMGVTCYLVQIY